MKRVLFIPFAMLVVGVIAACGFFFLDSALDILGAGKLTYARKGHPAATVSPGHHGFSYFYQVSYMATLGAFFFLLALSLGLFATAKCLRMGGSYGPRSAMAYAGGNYMAVGAFGFFALWFLLHCARYWMVA